MLVLLLCVAFGRCPVQDDHPAPEVLLEIQEPSYPLPYSTLARKVPKVHEVDKDGHSIYNVDFKPAHFTCLSCDVKTCEANNVVCDVSQCVGQFYENECWCRKDTTARLQTPLWQFRKFDSRFLVDDSVHRFFCDNKCQGGVCDVKGIQCKPRAEACSPWWWCNLPPPKEAQNNRKWPSDEFRETFLQKKAMTERKFEKNDYDTFQFKNGRWTCQNASLPPKIQDSTTYLWKNRGYIVFDRSSCEGSSFDHQCFCWDNVRYLRGEDALVSAFQCDTKCSYGICEGRTCGQQPPPPLPPPPPPAPIDPLEAELRGQADLNNIDVTMDRVEPLKM